MPYYSYNCLIFLNFENTYFNNSNYLLLLNNFNNNNPANEDRLNISLAKERIIIFYEHIKTLPKQISVIKMQITVIKNT